MLKTILGLILVAALGAPGAFAQPRHWGGGFGGPRSSAGYGRSAARGPEGPREDYRAQPPRSFAGQRGYGAPRGYGGGYPPERFPEPGPYRPQGPAQGYYAPRATYGAPGAPASGARGLTRGQFLPPAYWGGAVADPRVYHLRRPPNGYGWVTVGPNAYLTQRSTGLILDTAPLY